MTPFLKESDVQGALRLRLAAQGYIEPYSPLGVPISLPLRLLATRYHFFIDNVGSICPTRDLGCVDPYDSLNLDYYNWLGVQRPRFVLVGEKLSPQALSPWYPFIGGPASQYLWASLSTLNFNTFSSLAVTNAFGEESLLLDSVRGAARVVALGGKAGKALSDRRIEHETVVHPSWARRWGQLSPERYRELLLKALWPKQD